MYCVNCGSPLKKGKSYCKNCKKRNTSLRSKTGKKILAGICTGGLLVAAILSVFFFISKKQGAESKENETQEVAAQGTLGQEEEKTETGLQETDTEKTVIAKEDKGEAEENAGGPIIAKEDKEEAGADEEELIIAKEEKEINREDLEKKREEKILALSEQGWLLKEAARNLVADCLERVSFVTVSPREVFSIADVVLDEVSGNLIVSEGAKAAYRSALEGKSISDICQTALASAGAQIPQYLTDEAVGALQDMVTGAVGVNVFSAINFISQWKNANDVPGVLLQTVVEEQQKDVYRLILFLEQEETKAEDLYRVAHLMYAVQEREHEIAKIRNTVDVSGVEFWDMRVVAGKFAANEAQLLMLAQTEVPEKENLPEETDSFSEQQRMEEKLEFYGVLAETEFGEISVNYDIEGFREAQKVVSQQGILNELWAGSFLGGMFKESGQTNEDWVQKERAVLCDKLTDFMEESYSEVAAARAEFMGQYGMLQEMLFGAEEECGLMEVCLGQSSWEARLDEAAKNYLTALSKYWFDIDSAYILYDCILTSGQAGFLFELAIEKDQAGKVLRSYEGMEFEGYRDEEAVDRWSMLLEYYMQTLDKTIERGLTLGQTPGLHSNGSLIVYGDTTYRAYTKEFTAESTPLAIMGDAKEGRNPRYYYDNSGGILCVVYGAIKIIYRSGPRSISAGAGAEPQYRWNLESDALEQRIMDCTDRAAEMYDKFVQ